MVKFAKGRIDWEYWQNINPVLPWATYKYIACHSALSPFKGDWRFSAVSLYSWTSGSIRRSWRGAAPMLMWFAGRALGFSASMHTLRGWLLGFRSSVEKETHAKENENSTFAHVLGFHTAHQKCTHWLGCSDSAEFLPGTLEALALISSARSKSQQRTRSLDQ